MKILTTLAEHDYFLGLAALINSVVKYGTYVDAVIVGYRGPLPGWLPPIKDTERGKLCRLNSGLTIEFIEVKGTLHMVHEKPNWFKLVNDVLAPDADEYFFFDSDIVIRARMSFFGEWVKQGIALCEDIYYDMSYNHPARKHWEAVASKNGLTVNKKLERYYNSGFLGWSRSDSIFIKEWGECFNVLAAGAGDLKQFRVHDLTYPVSSANQDSLNLAAMITNQPLSTLGPSAMSFFPGMRLMAHPIVEKPWRRNFFIEFLKGKPPRLEDVIFWSNVNGSELKPINSFKLKYKMVLIKALKLFARFYSKK